MGFLSFLFGKAFAGATGKRSKTVPERFPFTSPSPGPATVNAGSIMDSGVAEAGALGRYFPAS
jgi:hypothetical protein